MRGAVMAVLRPHLVAFACVVLAAVFSRAGAEDAARYVTGGSVPLDPKLQRALDHHAGRVRLGLNPERLQASRIVPRHFVEAVMLLAECAERGEVAGGVLMEDTLTGDNMPVAVGDMMVDPERHPADWSTMYELGPLTGPVAVVPLVLAAVEKGRLSLSDPVGKFVPVLMETDKARITVEMLLRHSSGLPARMALPKPARTREEVLALLARLPLTAAPGARFERSGLNDLLLGLMMETLDCKPVLNLAEAQIFEPLGMVNTAGQLPAQWRQQCAPGAYSEWHGRMAWGEAENPVAFVFGPSAGNGGLCATADDLAVWSRAMIVGTKTGLGDFLSSQTLQMSLQPDPDLPGGANQGLGWALNGLGTGSFGLSAENGCSLWVQPERDGFVILLLNESHPGTNPGMPESCRSRILGWMEQAMEPKGPHACVIGKLPEEGRPEADYHQPEPPDRSMFSSRIRYCQT
ncbi:beta-lactamase family protein [Candidatus Poribacteria bacterium]|nr:beta-lactamase family protein [Candidatus Poribacteria bacterium]